MDILIDPFDGADEAEPVIAYATTAVARKPCQWRGTIEKLATGSWLDPNFAAGSLEYAFATKGYVFQDMAYVSRKVTVDGEERMELTSDIAFVVEPRAPTFTPKTPIIYNAGMISKALRDGQRLPIAEFPADHVTSTLRWTRNSDGPASVWKKYKDSMVETSIVLTDGGDDPELGRFRLFVSDKGDSSVPVQRQRWHPSETGVLVNTIIEKLTGMEVANRQAAGRLMIRNLLDIEERLRPFADEMEEKMESTGDSSAGLLRAQRETSGLMRALTTQLGLHPVTDIADHMRWHRVHSVVTHPDLQQWLPKTVETPERDLKPEMSEKDVVTVLKKLNRVLGQLHDVL